MPTSALQELSHWFFFSLENYTPLIWSTFNLIYQSRVEDRADEWSEKVNYFTWPLLCGWWWYICLPWEGWFNHGYPCAISNSQLGISVEAYVNCLYFFYKLVFLIELVSAQLNTYTPHPKKNDILVMNFGKHLSRFIARMILFLGLRA